MKKYLLSLAVFLSFNFAGAQITITQSDFADGLDTARMSEAVWNPLLDFGATGPNYTWDFSDLQWQGQFIDTFLPPLFTNPIYNFTFSNVPFNPYRCNIAKRGDNTFTTFPFLSTIFTNGYNFYYKTSNYYLQRGIGMRVSGFPTSVPMTHADTLYHFPMDFGNEDSAWSDYTVRIPDMGTYSHQQHRKNRVDGWGSLTTPFGTFDVLRHVTDIRGSDSLYIDTLNFGFKLNSDIQREYKWFAKDQMVPLLQINTQAGILGLFQTFEFVTRVIYRDSVRWLPTAIEGLEFGELSFNVFPNPARDNFMVVMPEALDNSSITITDVRGRTVLNKQALGTIESVDAGNWQRGLYFVTLHSGNQQSVRKLVIE